jgi:predicted nucleotidyltransferase
MSYTSKILLNKVADDIVIQLLTVVIPVLKHAGIDYFAVGAFARDVTMLAMGHTSPPERKTKDIDLAVMVGSADEFERLRHIIIALPDFIPDENEPYRFIFKNAYEVDFLPFGEISNEKGQVELLSKKIFILDLPGFDLIHPYREIVETEEGLTLHVSSLPAIVLLKFLAWQDQPSREKDIHDIFYILKHSFHLYFDEIIAEGLMDLYDGNDKLFHLLVPSRYLGQKIGIILKQNEPLCNRVRQLLFDESKKSGIARHLHLEFVEENQRLLLAILDGMNDAMDIR